jgi:hypothetical protein
LDSVEEVIHFDRNWVLIRSVILVFFHDRKVHGCKAGAVVSVTRTCAERAGAGFARIDPGGAAAAEGVRHAGERGQFDLD